MNNFGHSYRNYEDYTTSRYLKNSRKLCAEMILSLSGACISKQNSMFMDV